MFKNSVTFQLAVFLAVVAAITGGLSFSYSEAIPYLHSEFPSIRRVHDERPYVIESILSLVSLILSLFAISQIKTVKHGFKNGFGAFEALHGVLTTSEFSLDTGMFFLDANRKILSATQLPMRVAQVKSVAEMVGKRYGEVFPHKFARLIEELEAKSRTTRQPAAVEISDWSPYCPHPIGPVILMAMPAFRDGQYVGHTIVFRSATEIRLAEESAILHQQNYEVLFDNLQCGVAVCRLAVSGDGGPDAYVVEANPGFKRMMDGLPLPYTEPFSVAWPSFSIHDKLRQGIARVTSGEQSYQCQIFLPELGKHFDVTLAALSAGRFQLVFSDQTDVRSHEQQVLALNDRMQRNLARQSKYLSSLLDDIDHFHMAVSDVFEAQLDEVAQTAPNLLPPYGKVVSDACTKIYLITSQFNRYHMARSLPYQATTLVNPTEIAKKLLETLENRYPDVRFQVGALPVVVASQEVLTCIIERLLVTLASQRRDEAARIVVGGVGGFLTTGVCVEATGIDCSSLFLEIPVDTQPLDWTLTSDLELATVRRMVAEHGGEMLIGPTEQGEGVRITVTVGSPVTG
jgi:PAS domain-containing protein